MGAERRFRPAMWIGKCHTGNGGRGWVRQCANRTTANQAGAYFRIQHANNGQFQARRNGYIRINWYGQCYTSGRSWCHIQFYNHGTLLRNGHSYEHYWRTLEVDQTFRTYTNRNWWIQEYSSNGHNRNAENGYEILYVGSTGDAAWSNSRDQRTVTRPVMWRGMCGH